MRHSSWTLFLVPLALPLVFLCFPGATATIHQAAPPGAEGQGLVIDDQPATQGPTVLAATSSEDHTETQSESLFQD
jgi:hypothetical protein